MGSNPDIRQPPVQLEGPPPPGLKLDDVYYVLFRHKWKIIACSLLGLLAAVAVPHVKKPIYESHAKLLVRYVRDTKAIDASLGPQGEVRSPGGGENIIGSEIEILTSYDLAREVAELIGPEKVLAQLGGGTNAADAAGAILNGLKTEVPGRSSVIRVSFRHRDPAMVQAILSQLVQGYLRKHAEVHRATGVFDEFLTRQTVDLRSRLNQTEDELRKLQLQAGVTSATVEESKKLLADQSSRIRQEIMTAEADLAQRRSIVQKYLELAGAPAAAGTNAELPAVEAPLDPDKENQYRAIVSRLQALRAKEQDLLLQFTPESQDVRQVRDLVANAERTKQRLEADEPRLVRFAQRALLPASVASGTRVGAPAEMIDLVTEQAQIAALEARTNVLVGQLDKSRGELASINEAEAKLRELQRQKELQEVNYRYFSASLEQARIDESLGTSALGSISLFEEATPAGRDDGKTRKYALMALGGGIGFGLGLAFLLDLFLDPRIKRPADVEKQLRLPLFLSIPDFARNGRAKALRRNVIVSLQPKLIADSPGAGDPGESSHESSHESSQVPATLAGPLRRYHEALRTYHEALRDRLVMYFQLKEMTHKPKLVGVTGVSRNAGASLTAAGLAESLSETGDGNVLLVDMNPEGGPAAYPFHRGKPACGLTTALERDGRETAQVQTNLYVVSMNSDQGSRVGIVPSKLAHLLPKLKGSDYDYIIFDMPPVSQVSVTAKVAGLLDMTFLVVESERTNVEQAKRCAALLAESRANVAAVFNRYHNYVPKWLSNDI